jgi:general secretion pathway protein G
VVAIIGMLAAIAYPPFIGFLTTVRYQKGTHDLKNIESEIIAFVDSRGHLPDSLAEVGMDGMLDPWGNPYVYLRIEGNSSPGLNGKKRKDRNLNPVNTDFDLYSKGPDGETAAQFMAATARDDLVRANNGRYFGLAEEHMPL